MLEQDEFFMRKAIEAAQAAQELGEIPIGACLVDAYGEILSGAGNRTILDSDPTAHAEILVLRAAARRMNNYRLVDSTVYSTVEPCAMCAGALVNARVKRLVYGTADKRFGAVRSIFQICDGEFLNHKIEVTTGIFAEECRYLMQNFFKKKTRRAEIQRENCRSDLKLFAVHS